MWCYTFYLILSIVLVAHPATAHESFRIASLTRGFDVNNTESEVLGGSEHDCYRPCVAGDVRICKYSFTLVEYTTMSRLCGDCPYKTEDCHKPGCITAGGDIREVILANHKLPGPSIQVCEGDVVQVDVINTLSSHSSTIHWHGLHQKKTPYMDGTPFLTQCPIQPHNSFQYKFTADPPGTHIWHSHSGFEEADGLYGAFIVRAANDSLAQYYDYDLPEHVMAVWHWYYSSTASVLKTALHRSDSVIGYSLTINGLAATVKFNRDGVNYTTPRAEFTVTQGFRYRFRLMHNSALYCPVQVSIDNHKLLVIASEGGTFEPVEVDSLVINSGERYDFVLSADQEIDNYWIRYRGLGDCVSSTRDVSSEAILRYHGVNSTADPEGPIEYQDANRAGVVLNPVEVANASYAENSTLILLTDLNRTTSNQPDVSGTPDHIIYMQYSYNNYYDFHSPGPFPQINYVSFEFPPIPLLTQSEQITDDIYCSETNSSSRDCVGEYCTCPFIYMVGLNSLVEVVIVDEGLDRFDDHPMHLHGHNFQVVAMESIGGSISLDEVKRRNENGTIPKKLIGAPNKDNVGVPAQGFVILRLIANNPGYWFFHCHISNHAEMGMGVVLKVGEHEDMIQPPDSFPTCGHWDVTKKAASSSAYSILLDAGGKNGIIIFYLLIVAVVNAVRR
ncbi:laccase-4-like [Athalia rosae]|uniref:laccase-4-like n=1 Tax=Athalia rosae TaxID=37344 RepID=UPI002033469E|nr:laccase-4-like [Athalia rosae]